MNVMEGIKAYYDNGGYLYHEGSWRVSNSRESINIKVDSLALHILEKLNKEIQGCICDTEGLKTVKVVRVTAEQIHGKFLDKYHRRCCIFRQAFDFIVGIFGFGTKAQVDRAYAEICSAEKEYQKSWSFNDLETLL
ncbi:MAG: hypothetical protein H7A37_08515 [Chlamydiales bacterium]|nr:hypothetical protein [Chlamydiia bacterium]MCP5508321.1 hypothetical protein [Chlamydiales bacterium]